MLSAVQHENTVNSDTFSVATLFYARLRRVTGRVVDVMYLVENKEYAHYTIEIAMKANDAELDRLVHRLYSLLDLGAVQETPTVLEDVLSVSEPVYLEEATEEEIYKAQVSHHYIGALR